MPIGSPIAAIERTKKVLIKVNVNMVGHQHRESRVRYCNTGLPLPCDSIIVVICPMVSRAVEAEAQACLVGINHVINTQCKAVTLEYDCIQVVQTLSNGHQDI
jgi:hypothetical protein